MLIHRAGAKHLYIPGGSLGVRACSAGEIGGAGRVTSTRSVQFDGINDYIDVSGVASGGTVAGGAHSVSLWAKLTSWSSNQTAFGFGLSGSRYSEVDFSAATNRLVARTVNLGPENSVSSLNTYSSDSNWHHIVWCVDANGGVVGFYIDSVSQGTDTTSSIDLSPCTVAYIGQLPWSSPNINPWHGLIDDPRIYNTALSPTDVANLYAGVDVTAGLVAYWALEEGSGTNAVDTIGGNDGTLTNGPTWSTDVPTQLGG